MVKRYDLTQIDDGYDDDTPADTIMGECVSGEFVRYEDYEEVADNLANCQAQVKWLQDRLTGPQCLR